jgi:hypothetical protein
MELTRVYYREYATLRRDTFDRLREHNPDVPPAQILTVADVKRLKEEHARSGVPLQTRAVEARELERAVSDLVNAAYGLTTAEVSLMWRTARRARSRVAAVRRRALREFLHRERRAATVREREGNAP